MLVIQSFQLPEEFASGIHLEFGSVPAARVAAVSLEMPARLLCTLRFPDLKQSVGKMNFVNGNGSLTQSSKLLTFRAGGGEMTSV